MRWVGRFFALVGVLIFLVVLAVGTAAYLTVTGKSLPAVKFTAERAGNLLAGQKTDHLQLDVNVRPDEGWLSGRATLTVRSTQAGRRRLYFLLNNGLRLRSARVENDRKASAYQVWMLVVVELGHALKADETVDVTLDYEGKPGHGPFGTSAGLLDPRNVLLDVDEFWFPTDLQGQFTADVSVTLPANLTIVHAGDEEEHSLHGRLQRVRWTYARPVPGLALVAGSYRVTEAHRGQTRYRVFLDDDVDLDAGRILDTMSDTDNLLTAHYGSSGYPTLTLFVSRRLRRGFNDGSGLIGLSIRYFRRGDYGFEIIAHEIAHDWWGATVMEQWLHPGTGGEWLVEGFAEFSSVVATEERFGKEALVRRLAREAYDPRRPRAVAPMSILDNALDEAGARDIIYNKGAYVAWMLRKTVGDDAFFKGLRAFIDKYRGRAATDRDLQETLQSVTGQDLSAFFDAWVRSGRNLDLTLDAGDTEGKVALGNAGDNKVVGDSRLWVVRPDQPAPETHTLRVGEQIQLGPKMDHAVTDPELAWADMYRSNNLFPRRRFPLLFGVSSTGVRSVVEGALYPWSPSTLRLVKPGGAEFAHWDLDSSVLTPPAWIDDHRILLSMSDADHAEPAIVVLDTRDGKRRTIGYGYDPVITGDTVYAARDGGLLRWSSPSWHEDTAWHTVRGEVERPLPSPDGGMLAYAVTSGNDLELRVRPIGKRTEKVLLVWDRSLRSLAWSPDGTKLYVAVGGSWDWQVWEVPVDGEPVKTLVQGAAAVGEVSVSPNGQHLAFPAAPALDYPRNRKQVIVLDFDSKAVNRFDVPNCDVREVAWSNDDTLVALTSPEGGAVPWHLPEERSLVAIHIADGTIKRLSGAPLPAAAESPTAAGTAAESTPTASPTPAPASARPSATATKAP